MNIHAPGFAVAEQYRDRLVAAGVIDAEPQQLLISDAAESSDAPGGLRTPGAPSGDGSSGPVPATGDAVAVERAASVPVASPRKAINNGASDIGDGLSEPTGLASAIAGGAQGRNERDRAVSALTATTAVTTENSARTGSRRSGA